MNEAKKRAELDQGLALLLEYYPIQWRRLYVRLVEEGFESPQAFDLVKTFIAATCGRQREAGQ